MFWEYGKFYRKRVSSAVIFGYCLDFNTIWYGRITIFYSQKNHFSQRLYTSRTLRFGNALTAWDKYTKLQALWGHFRLSWLKILWSYHKTKKTPRKKWFLLFFKLDVTLHMGNLIFDVEVCMRRSLFQMISVVTWFYRPHYLWKPLPLFI